MAYYTDDTNDTHFKTLFQFSLIYYRKMTEYVFITH